MGYMELVWRDYPRAVCHQDGRGGFWNVCDKPGGAVLATGKSASIAWKRAAQNLRPQVPAA